MFKLDKAFFSYVIFPKMGKCSTYIYYGQWVESASNRNECQAYLLRVKATGA